MAVKQMTKKEVVKRIVGLDKGQAKDVVCALIGHSNIETNCFGYVSCARCEAQIGDTLGGAYENKASVLVGHDCKLCRANTKKLTWRDRLLIEKLDVTKR